MTEASNPSARDHPGAPAAQVARFGVFELDLRTNELHRDGVRVKLQEQPLRLLSVLVESAGEVVTREELRQKLWPSEFVDFDHSLNAAIRKLRSALDDSADNPRFVETLARRGYRFIAPVSWLPATTAAPPVASAGRLLWPIAVVLIAATLMGGFFLMRRRVTPPTHRIKAEEARIDAVAVLPFMTDEPANEPISDGLTEVLIDTLSRLPKLRVMARTSVFRYRGNADPARAGRELNVAALVTGRVRRDHDQYAVRVELIDARDGTQIWAGQFHGTSANFSTVQTQIAGALSDNLRRKSEMAPAGTRYSKDPEAMELYLKGLHAWNKRGPDDLRLSIDYFNRAIARVPNFAAAYSGLAKSYGVMSYYGLISAADGITKVIAAAEKALELDPNNAEALVSLATTKDRNTWDFAGADRDFRHAIAVNPNYATGHQWYADHLRMMGRWDESRREMEIAYRLDPLSPAINMDRCYTLYVERRYRDAIAYSQRASKLDPRFGSAACVAKSLFALGEVDKAFATMTVASQGSLRGCEAMLAEVYRKSGQRGFLERSTELLVETELSGNPQAPVEIAGMYAQMGNHDAAFLWLERAYNSRTGRLTDIGIEPMFDPIRKDPRFERLLRRIGLPKVTAPAPRGFHEPLSSADGP